MAEPTLHLEQVTNWQELPTEPSIHKEEQNNGHKEKKEQKESSNECSPLSDLEHLFADFHPQMNETENPLENTLNSQWDQPMGEVVYAREPPEFDGKKDDYKNFKRLAQNYAKAYAKYFNTKEEYNRWLISYFTKGEAAKYAKIIEDNGWIEKLTTEEIWKKLDAHFYDHRSVHKAAEALEITRQGKTDIQEYLEWFEEKCELAGYVWHKKKKDGTFDGKDPNHIRLLDKNLRSRIVDIIHSNEEVPVNYIPYREKALNIGINLENREDMKKMGGYYRRWVDSKDKGSKGLMSGGTSSMVVGRPGVSVVVMRINRTTARTKGLCYKCGMKWGEGKDCDRCKRKGI
ncbi:hypothetical protein VKT23_002899 [Stygiomarasmius scandens]|uniref:Retrotransposon gag domain-containing protein n=1 Tax=Marasmiellus scandens TaxID=2682957 RepID=A0ABR1JXC9_9AGAR